MLFHSYLFIFLFLPVTAVVYYALHEKTGSKTAKGWLVMASLFFYGWWNILYLPLLLASILANFAVGLNLAKADRGFLKRFSRRQIFIAGIIFNLAFLGYFKYTNFLFANINWAFNANFIVPVLILPLGISFFTFQQIAFLVDVYRGEACECDLLNYLLFVTFFPKLIAGPIALHKEIMPQFAIESNQVKHYPNIALGLLVFSMGLFKKVVLADTLSQWATLGFESTQQLHFIEAWATSLSYTFQIYFDFSGYTDMAIGAALLFNIKLPINFNSPYKAASIQEFWRRWHISLSNFLRNYIYIGLGGNRKGSARTYLNLFITFVLAGLWHGPGWMFIIWGALHGGALVVHRFWKKLGFQMPIVVGWFITFNFCNFAWIFFRAKNWDDSLNIIKGMLGLQGVFLPEALSAQLDRLQKYGVKLVSETADLNFNIETLIWLIAAGILSLTFRNSTEKIYVQWNPSYAKFVVAGAGLAAALIMMLLESAAKSKFVYFTF